MKQILILASSALLLFSGCVKENLSASRHDEGFQTVTFSTQMVSNVTKAAADGDGAAANVNRCIMEVYYGEELFTRMYQPVDAQKHASFTTQLVSNRTYTVAFWADNVNNPNSQSGLSTDKYYNTKTVDGLKAVSLKGTYLGNKDERDAFAHCANYTVEQGGSVFEAQLTRPFAQINVITTDVATIKKVASLVPEKVNVLLKSAVNQYNVITGLAVPDQVANLSYEANLYNWDDTKSECTLSMDYIFAGQDKSVIDIEWQAKKTGDTPVSHSFTSVPYQRNYRTNIKGALLTTTGKWDVTVEPSWESDIPTPGAGDHTVCYTTVSNLNEISQQISNKSADSNLDGQSISIKVNNEVSGTTNPDIIIPNGTESSATPEIILDFTKINSGSSLVIRDEYHDPTSVPAGKMQEEYDGSVTVIVPDGYTADQVSILTDKSHVLVKGQYGNVIASCSPSTIVIEKGSVISVLTIEAGNVEIFGTVGTLERSSGNESESTVVIQHCGGEITNQPSDNKISITKYLVGVEGVGEYFNLVEAIEAVPANGTKTTVKLYSDFTDTYIAIETGKFVDLNLGSYTISAPSPNPDPQKLSWKPTISVNGGKLIVHAEEGGSIIRPKHLCTGNNFWESGIKATGSAIVTIYGGTIIGGEYPVWAVGTSHIDIYGGILRSWGGYEGLCICGDGTTPVDKGASCNIYGGTIHGILNGSNGYTGKVYKSVINIYGGTITHPVGGDYFNWIVRNVASMAISGGTFTSEGCDALTGITWANSNLISNCGTLTVEGSAVFKSCSIKNKRACVDNVSGKYAPNGSSSKNTYYGNATISSGTFNTECDNVLTNALNCSLSVTGGTYNKLPNVGIAEGYKVHDNGNGTWTVKQNSNIL